MVLDVEFSEELGGRLSFKHENAVLKWLQEEVVFWEWLQGLTCADNNAYQNTRQIVSFHNQLRNFLESYKNNETLDIAQLNNTLMSMSGSHVFHSASPRARSVSYVHQRYGQEMSLPALAFALRIRGAFNASLPDTLDGIIHYNNFLSGIDSKSVEFIKADFEKSKKLAVNSFAPIKGNATKLVNLMDQKIEYFDRRISVLSKWSQSRWEAYKSEKDSEVLKSIEQLSNTEKTYIEYMKLKAPVDYWKQKSKDHEKSAKVYKSYVISFFPLSIILMLYFILLCGKYIDIHGQDLQLIVGTMILVLTTSVLWVGRILVRLFLSEHHLSIDSKERAIMAQSYLALISDGNVGSNHIDAILGALFRPTTDGIVKDDASPSWTPSSILAGKQG